MLFDVHFSCSLTCHFVELLNLWYQTFLIFRKCQPFIYSNIVPSFSSLLQLHMYSQTVSPEIFQGTVFSFGTFFYHVIWILLCYIFKFLTLFIYTCYYLHSVYFSSYHHVFRIHSGFTLLKHIRYSYTKILNRLIC